MTLNKKFEFLSSVRFWKLFIIAVFQFLASQGIITLDVAMAMTILLGGSVAVNTFDRMGENIGPFHPEEIMMKEINKKESEKQILKVPTKNLHKA